LITLLYPLLIWFGHDRIEPRMLAMVLIAAALTRLPLLKISGAARCWLLIALALAGAAIWHNALLPLKLYPVAVSAAFLGVFGYSLLAPPTAIERIARGRGPALPPFAVAYTRRVTQVWCGFFLLNGGIALATAQWAPAAVWSLYTGVVYYVLMGLLFAVEYLVRIQVKKRHHA
jgi:uncharacterized membrane protein